jgi:hypothetical protein
MTVETELAAMITTASTLVTDTDAPEEDEDEEEEDNKFVLLERLFKFI